MDDRDLLATLTSFAAASNFKGKGPLCVALFVTDQAKILGLPLDARQLVTERGGQVRGLGKASVQRVLARHEIQRVLASEGGRTSRGSLDNMQVYVEFLNRLEEGTDLDAVEGFWVDRVREFFAAGPLKMRLDAGMCIQAVVRDLIDQAKKREMEIIGRWYAGTVVQHLTGALIDCCFGVGRVAHHSSSTADLPSGRSADFDLGKLAIHVTTSPGEAVIQRCVGNLEDGLRPVLVVRGRSVSTATDLANREGVEDRVDVLAFEQLISLGVFALEGLAVEERKSILGRIVARYNEIIDEVETDPSLKIKLG